MADKKPLAIALYWFNFQWSVRSVVAAILHELSEWIEP
jgi:hypothetical protein